jgi:hypothetical protein
MLINPAALVVIDRLKRAGFNLDIVTADWSTLAQRWVRNDAPEQGGWNLLPVVYTGFDMANPLSNPGIGYNCTGNQPWNYCVPEMTPVLERFAAESDGERHRPHHGPVRQPRRLAVRAARGDRLRLPRPLEYRACRKIAMGIAVLVPFRHAYARTASAGIGTGASDAGAEARICAWVAGEVA